MEYELCLLKSAALAVIKKPSDLYLMAAFLIISIIKLRGQPVFIHIAMCNVFWVLTAAYAPETYWLLCFISSSYVFQYYYEKRCPASIPVFLLSILTLVMGFGTIFEYIGIYGLYDSLYNSYEIYVTCIYIAIILCLIDWSRVFRYLGDVIIHVRSGQVGTNNLFGIL